MQSKRKSGKDFEHLGPQEAASRDWILLDGVGLFDDCQHDWVLAERSSKIWCARCGEDFGTDNS